MGTIGLLAGIAGAVLGWRRWRGMRPDQKQDAFPFVLALALVLFPVNTHFALYGTYISTLIWFLVGLWASVIEPGSRQPPRTEQASEN